MDNWGNANTNGIKEPGLGREAKGHACTSVPRRGL